MNSFCIDTCSEKLHPLSRYTIAVALAIFAITMRHVLLPISSGAKYTAFYPFVILSFYLGGNGPGIVTTIITAASVIYIFEPPYNLVELTSMSLRQSLLYITAAGSCGYIVSRMHCFRRSLAETQKRLAKDQLDHAQDRFTLAVNGARLGVWKFLANDTTLSFSGRFAKHFGLSDSISTESYVKILSIIHPGDQAKAFDALNVAINEKSDFALEQRVIWKDGTIHWIYVHGRPYLNGDGTLKQFDGISLDLTELRLAEIEIRNNLAIIKAAFDSMNEAILIGDTEGNLTSYNDAATTFFRYKEEGSFFKTVSEFSEHFDLTTRDDRPIIHPYHLALQGVRQTYQVKIRSRDTGETWYALSGTSPIFNEEHHIIGAASTAYDITSLIELQNELEEKVKQRTAEIASANQALKELSRHDALTGLHNKLACNERLRSEFERMKRTGDVYGVLMLDIDFFKRVNDIFGHVVGDDVLICVANSLSRNLRQYDFIARWGGEEFHILLPSTGLKEASVVAEKLRAVVETTPHPVAGKITISLGICITGPDQKDEEFCVIKADEALYEAKGNGRNRVVASNSSSAQADTVALAELTRTTL